MDYFMPFIMTVLAAIGGWAVKELSKSNEVENELKELQIKKEEKDALTTLGWEIFYKIEEDFNKSKVGTIFKSKLATFETMIRNRVPDISAQDMDLLNKSIAGEFHKDEAKVITAVSNNISDNTLEMPFVYVTPPVVDVTPVAPAEPEGVLIAPIVPNVVPEPVIAPVIEASAVETPVQPIVEAVPIKPVTVETEVFYAPNGRELVYKEA